MSALYVCEGQNTKEERSPFSHWTEQTAFPGCSNLQRTWPQIFNIVNVGKKKKKKRLSSALGRMNENSKQKWYWEKRPKSELRRDQQSAAPSSTPTRSSYLKINLQGHHMLLHSSTSLPSQDYKLLRRPGFSQLCFPVLFFFRRVSERSLQVTAHWS